MKIIEHMKNIFASTKRLPSGTIRKAEYDIVLLYDLFGSIPSIIKTKDNRKYMYFENITDEQLNIVRKMGFRPKRIYVYSNLNRVSYRYRAPITFSLSNAALEMVAKIESSYYKTKSNFPMYAKKCMNDSAYQQYIQIYKGKTK